MPGFYGVVCREKPYYSRRVMEILSRHVHVSQWASKGSIALCHDGRQVHLGVVSIHQGLASLQLPEVFPAIFFEGYFYDISGEPSVPRNPFRLREILVKYYCSEGFEFLKRLHGSFSMVILDSDGITLVTDRTCSRPLYVFESHKFLAWSPEFLPLLITFKEQLSLNERNIGQILCSEFSFIDDTIVKEIFCMRQGEILSCRENQIKREHYARFRYTEGIPDSCAFKQNLVSSLNTRAMEAISKQWATADAPAILLSGGLDSRYIVSAIAEIVSDTTKLQLVTWGVPEYRRFSDLEVSKQIAYRLGAKHIILERTEEKIVEELEETFQLIGCEVDSFFHVNERLLLAMLRQRYGIRSLFRGEEAFGWGEYRKNLKYALNQIIVSYPEDNPWLKEIFRPAFYEKMLEGWHKRLGEILREYHHQSVNDLKDSLYFNWRLARYLSTLSYFKLAYIEQFNPLLDPSVIEFNQRVPTRLRVDKKLFRMAFRAKQSLLNGIPLATRNNLENWEKVIRRNPVIFKYVREKLEIENEIFKNAGHLSTSLVRASGTNGPQPGDRVRNLFQYHPFIRQTKLFGALNKLRHLYVKPPQETVRVKLLFRAAQVKDFLHRYWS